MQPIVLLTALMALPPAPKPAAVAFSQISASVYNQARQKAKPTLAPATFPVRARNRQLVIPTTAGPQVFQDVVVDEAALARGLSEDESTTYTYRGFLTGFQRHVVEVTFYETQEWWLISSEGRRLTLYGAPLYSPDQQNIATVCAGIEYSGGQPNALQLFRLQDGVLRKVWEVQPKKWEPQELFWTSPHTLYLKRNEAAGTEQSRLTYWKITVAATP